MYQELSAVWDGLTQSEGPFELHEVVIDGVPMRCYRNAPPSLREVWLASAQYADREYLCFGTERLTYAEVHQRVAAVAHWLREQGVQPGDRVAIAMRNYPEWMQAYWAVVASGAVVVGMNAWWVADEMAYALRDSEPKVLIADSERLQRFDAIRDEFSDLLCVAVRSEASPDGYAWASICDQAAALPDWASAPDADACIFYTSGTTGRPKGARLSHRGCVSNILNMAFIGTAQTLALAAAAGQAPPTEPPAPPIALVCTPLFHVTANNCLAHAATVSGGKLVHLYRWDPAEALRLVEQEGITHFSGVPTMARELLQHPDFAQRDTSSLQAVGGGGAALQPDLVEKLASMLANGRPTTGYGMTEASGLISGLAGPYFLDKPHSAGRPLPTYEAKCVNADGEDCGLGEVGELWLRGPTVVKGYLNQPEASEDTMVDGWLRTGDLAYFDEHGFLFLVDRLKDMVLRGGENVYCSEVESALFALPGVLECAVFGVSDSRLGEAVAAAVYTDGKVSAETLRVALRERLAAYKIPQYLWLLAEPLPRNASGKFLKKTLRETLPLAAAQ